MDTEAVHYKVGFGVIDYVIFALTMVLSVSVGIYFAVTGGKQRTTSEYLVANRRMRIAPVALSLIVSFESSIMMLGFPAEMYAYGVQFWTFHIGLIVCIFLIVQTIVPLVHPLKLTSVYEYLEQRYKSRGVRLMGSFLGILNYVWYMGVVLYGPATALEAVTGFANWNSVILITAGAVLYTAIGGIKAVIWTDALQFIVMVAGILAVIIMGCYSVGGIGRVFQLCNQGGRLQFFDFDFNPTTRHTFWNLAFAGMIRPIYLGLNQASIQRVSAIENLNSAKTMMMLSYPGFLLFGTLACLEGLIAYAYFAHTECDPFAAKFITNSNQVLPYFVMELFQNLPGLPGLFLASLFSASLRFLFGLLQISIRHRLLIFELKFTCITKTRDLSEPGADPGSFYPGTIRTEGS